MKNLFRKAFVVGYWDVVYANSLDDLLKDKVEVINSTLFEWYADPFIYFDGDQKHIFVERKKLSRKNGCISEFRFIGNGFEKKPYDIISEPYHMSFPNPVVINNEMFIMPETSRGRVLNLYKYDFKSRKTTFFKTLLSDVGYVDSVVFKENEKQYIYCYEDKSDAVCVYSVSKDWEMTNKGRINTDTKTLRPAGNPQSDTLYCQDCSKIYGESISRYQIDFEKMIVNKIEPDAYILGIEKYVKEHGYKRYHTINKQGESFVFDVYKERINLLMPLLFIIRKIRNK